MQEDKELKILLQENAIQQTSSSFNNDVMRRINITPVQSTPLINRVILKSLIAIFFAAFLAMIICFICLPVNNFPVNFSLHINNNVYSQLYSFIVTFWIIMLLNILWNKWQTYHGVMPN